MTNKVNNKQQLVAILLRIQTLCESSRNGPALMQFVLERMRLLVPLLRLLWNAPSNGTLLAQVYADLKTLKNSIKKLSKLNRIVYWVQAFQLQKDLIHGEITGINQTLASASMDPAWMEHYSRECQLQDQQFALFQQALQQEQASMANGSEDILKVLARVLGGHPIALQEVQNARRILQIELGELLSQQGNNRCDPVARNKVIEVELYWQKILRQLEKASLQLDNKSSGKEPLFPDWAMDPLTQSCLIHPVTVRADCQHTVSMATFQSHLEQGHKTCPVCQTTLKALCGMPNKKLQRRIHKLSLGDDHNNMDESGHLSITSSSSHHSGSSLDGCSRHLSRLLNRSWSSLTEPKIVEEEPMQDDSLSGYESMHDGSDLPTCTSGNSDSPALHASPKNTSPKLEPENRISDGSTGRSQMELKGKKALRRSFSGSSSRSKERPTDEGNQKDLKTKMAPRRTLSTGSAKMGKSSPTRTASSSGGLVRVQQRQKKSGDSLSGGSLHSSSSHSAVKTRVTIVQRGVRRNHSGDGIRSKSYRFLGRMLGGGSSHGKNGLSSNSSGRNLYTSHSARHVVTN